MLKVKSHFKNINYIRSSLSLVQFWGMLSFLVCYKMNMHFHKDFPVCKNIFYIFILLRYLKNRRTQKRNIFSNGQYSAIHLSRLTIKPTK